MLPLAKLRAGAVTAVGVTAVVAVAGFLFTSGARTEDLKHYDSNSKQFWTHPPDDWFMGDETKELQGTNYLKTLPPATGFTKEEVEAKLKNISCPPASRSSCGRAVSPTRGRWLGATRARCSSAHCLAAAVSSMRSSMKAATES
jgi:hypothetical protein